MQQYKDYVPLLSLEQIEYGFLLQLENGIYLIQVLLVNHQKHTVTVLDTVYTLKEAFMVFFGCTERQDNTSYL